MEFSLLSMNGLEFIFRWVHLLAGVLWIGILYYINFIQGTWFNEANPQVKTAAQAGLLPKVLWWFRWGAMYTFITGWIIILSKGHSVGHSIYLTSWGLAILSGGLLGSIMWANVWFVIWPNNKKIIASAEAVLKGGQADPNAAAAAAKGLLASRTNVLFSVPMLFFMGAASHLPLNMSGEGLMKYWIAFAVIVGALEFNALKGKLGPMKTIVGVIHCGLALAVVLYVLAELLA